MPVGHLRAMLDQPEAAQPDGLAPVRLGPFTLSENGLRVEGEPSYAEWAAVGHYLAVTAKGLAFQVGDWIRYGEAAYGELAAQVIDARHWAPETVRNYVWLSEKVPPQNRMLDRLPLRHHQLVAALPPDQQRRWLRRALNDGGPTWKISQLRQAIIEGSEVEATDWFLVVRCRDEASRDELKGRLEGMGLQCRPSERYTRAKTIDV